MGLDLVFRAVQQVRPAGYILVLETLKSFHGCEGPSYARGYLLPGAHRQESADGDHGPHPVRLRARPHARQPASLRARSRPDQPLRGVPAQPGELHSAVGDSDRIGGLILFGYVLGHMLGNLQVFAPDHDQINHYAAFLHSPVNFIPLWAIQIGSGASYCSVTCSATCSATCKSSRPITTRSTITRRSCTAR